MFYHYKDFFPPVLLMAVAGTDCRFMYVDVSSYGKDCDSTMFKRSTLWALILTNKQKFTSTFW